MKTKFNLATSPLENNRRFIAGAGALGLIAILALFMLSFHAYRNWDFNREIRTDISRFSSQISAYERQQEALRKDLGEKNAVEVMGRAAFLNGLIAERTFPWIKMFSDLEHILPPGVRVISISPQRDKEGNVKLALAVGGQDDESILKFLKALEASPAFSNIQPGAETRPANVNADGSGDRVLLSLEARYSTI